MEICEFLALIFRTRHNRRDYSIFRLHTPGRKAYWEIYPAPTTAYRTFFTADSITVLFEI